MQEDLLEPPLDLTASDYVSIDFGGICHGCPIGMLEDKVFDTTGIYQVWEAASFLII